MTERYLQYRKQRGIAQKLFLIEISEDEREYKIMGTRGNIYNVSITNNPTCTCPDYTTRGTRCKHIFFVLIKIMNVVDPDKESYTSNDLIDIFNNKPKIDNTLYVNDEIRDKYLKLTDNNKKIIIKDNDLCPICLEDIHNGEEYDYCKNRCGKCVHKICFTMWCTMNKAKCLFCRAPWSTCKYINLKE